MVDWKLEMKLPAARNAIKGGRTRGLVAATEHVLGVSNMHVPHETGDLERTGSTSVDSESGRGAVSYKDADYKGQARDQHDNETYHHDAGRNAHFLADALRSERATVAAILAQQVKSGLGGK